MCMCPKKLTKQMKVELAKKCKVKVDNYGYRRNTIDEIELIDVHSGESIVFNKSEYRLKF